MIKFWIRDHHRATKHSMSKQTCNICSKYIIFRNMQYNSNMNSLCTSYETLQRQKVQTGESTLKKNTSFHFTEIISEAIEPYELFPRVRALCWMDRDGQGWLWSGARRTSTAYSWEDKPSTCWNCISKPSM